MFFDVCLKDLCCLANTVDENYGSDLKVRSTVKALCFEEAKQSTSKGNLETVVVIVAVNNIAID